MDGNVAEEEALSLKTRAEAKYKLGNLKSALRCAKKAQSLNPKLEGISEMVTAFKILRIGGKSAVGESPNWYKVLQVEPFCHIYHIKKQYKKLALTLHPDKNPLEASEEAFKLVGDAFRFLSDKISRKEYDLKLRIAIQSEALVSGRVVEPVETFWTACSTCRLLHQFESKYIGHNLVCPSCKKSFLAVEVSGDEAKDKEDGVGTRSSARVKARTEARASEKEKEEESSSKRSRIVGMEWKTSSLEKAQSNQKIGSAETRAERSKTVVSKQRTSRVRVTTIASRENMSDVDLRVQRPKLCGSKEKMTNVAERSRLVGSKQKLGNEGELLRISNLKGAKNGEEMTLAEMQLVAVEKARGEKMKLKSNEKDKDKEKKERRVVSFKPKENGKNKENERRVLKERDLEIMAVEDSDFYDFDNDRVERSFKKGQIWATYDDDDGMPRYYGLIDEVVSVNPFEVKMSWLDFQPNGEESVISFEKLGFHVSCGRFKVGLTTSITSVSIFSHIVDCERAAREIYRIYPKKGCIWAFYNEQALENELSNPSFKQRCYDIVVLLTSYSEMHGLSLAYLEKVGGFKSVFSRREIGSHAIRWLEKDDIRLFSHQIPARKLSGPEAPDIGKDCWELDPASLPPELLCIDSIEPGR